MDSAWEAYRLEVAEAGAGEGEGPNNNAVEAVGGEEVAKGKTLGSTPAGGDGFSFGAVPALPAIDATTKTRTTATTSKNRKSAIPTKNYRTSHKQKWESWLARLRAFKERQGHVNVPRGYEDKELGKFVNHQRNNYRLLLEGKQNSLTTERIQDLEKLGFQWTLRPETLFTSLPNEADCGDEEELDAEGKMKAIQGYAETAIGKNQGKGRAMDNETWNNRLGELQRFNEKNGHFRVPSANRRGTKHRRLNEEAEEETIKLGKWAKRQRHLFSKNELPRERSVALEQIGFDFKPAPATKEERLEVQLGLLDALRKQRELSNAQVEDLNFLFDEWKRRANEPKTKPAFAKESNNKFDVKWQQNFELLKQFQLKNGHTRVPQSRQKNDAETDPDIVAFRSLGKWVDYQRQTYWKSQKGEKSPMTEDRIAQLDSIGFEWRIQQILPMVHKDLVPLKTAEESDDDEEQGLENMDLSSVFPEARKMDPSENLTEYKWNIHYEELGRYKGLTGSTRVSKCEVSDHQQQLSKLYNWVDRQRKLHHKRMRGEKNGSISKSRIRRLEAVDFDFGFSHGRPGWDAKLDLLKAFKEKHGHVRVPSRKKGSPNYDSQMQSLSKWVEHQRSMYWKKVKGEKNSLSEERISALNAVGMEWRVVRMTAHPGIHGTLISHVAAKAGTNSEEGHARAPTIDSEVAKAAELSAAHQDSIPQLAPASVDVDEPMEKYMV